MLPRAEEYLRPPVVATVAGWLSGRVPGPPRALGAPVTPLEALTLARVRHVAPALWLRVRDGVDGGFFPATERSALRDDFLGNVDRNRRLRGVLLETLAGVAKAGHDVLILKGGIQLVAPPGGNPALRIMGDLDLLARTGEAEDVQGWLKQNGWDEVGDESEDEAWASGDTHHLPKLRHRLTRVDLELHHRPLKGMGPEWTEAYFAESRLAPGLPGGVRIPGEHHRRLHNALHAFSDRALAHLCAWESLGPEAAVQQVDLRQLLDFCELIGPAFPSPDWGRLETDSARLGCRHDVHQWAFFAGRLMGMPIPDRYRRWPWFRPEVRGWDVLPRYLLRNLTQWLGLKPRGIAGTSPARPTSPLP